MKIAILSDTHDQAQRIRLALALARDRGAELVIHCGDIERAEMIELFRGWKAHFVFGNCDWDITELTRCIADIGATLHDGFGHLDIDGVAIAFTHGHERRLLEDLEASAAYAYLFHGHTHVAVDRRVGPTRVINPGALYRADVKRFVVLDTATGEAESVIVEGSVR